MPFLPGYNSYNSSYSSMSSMIKKFTTISYYSDFTNRNVSVNLTAGMKWGVPTFGIKFRF